MIAVIRATGANFSSVRFALQRLGVESLVTDSRDVIATASHVIMPGVGSARAAMAKLHAAGLVEVIRQLEQPVLGICLGMQLMFEMSEEGDTPGLGLFGGRVKALTSADGYPVPHMGWNRVTHLRGATPAPDGWAYFVHSYAAPVGPETIATTTYAESFSAIVARDNFVGVQFHPERSADFGSRLLSRFLEDKRIPVLL